MRNYLRRNKKNNKARGRRMKGCKRRLTGQGKRQKRQLKSLKRRSRKTETGKIWSRTKPMIIQ